jgi:ribonucleoside-diphosphate reductase beta chain
VAGDVSAAEAQLYDPQRLYEGWERGQWSPFEIDLARDAEDWAAMRGPERGLVLFALSSLIVAEERITTQFAGLVMSYDSEEEATFLATQLVDEARHMQHYARVQDQVIADPAAIAVHVERAREHLSHAFRTIFDERLVAAHAALVADPRNRSAKVDFVATYHLVIEGTLGVTSFHFITQLLNDRGLLPGFVDGYTRIHQDERRHIAYGTWFLREAVRADPDMADRVRATLRDLLPAVGESLSPPGDADASVLGATPDEIRNFAIDGLSRRLNIIGVPLETL